ncbi:hypothetical protein COC54_26305 [Bacillus pseudomycoides]|nr:hypothetical protein COC54_26305 [Bacillus pseudomycoides]
MSSSRVHLITNSLAVESEKIVFSPYQNDNFINKLLIQLDYRIYHFHRPDTSVLVDRYSDRVAVIDRIKRNFQMVRCHLKI